MKSVPLPNGHGRYSTYSNRYGWIGQACEFLCNRQNHVHRDRRGLFFIHKIYGLLNRHPKKVSFLILTRFLHGEVTPRPIYRTNQKRLCE
jgi:hypothetical protein